MKRKRQRLFSGFLQKDLVTNRISSHSKCSDRELSRWNPKSRVLCLPIKFGPRRILGCFQSTFLKAFFLTSGYIRCAYHTYTPQWRQF